MLLFNVLFYYCLFIYIRINFSDLFKMVAVKYTGYHLYTKNMFKPL